MRIAHIIDSLNWGGAQKLEVTFASAARERGLAFTVINLRYDANTPIPDELEAFGANVVTFPAPSLFDPMRVWRVTQFLRREKIEIVQTHLAYANMIGAIAGKLAGVPVIATLHSVGFDKRHDHPLKQKLEALVMRTFAARIVAVGYLVAQAHRARFGGRALEVIPNAVLAPPPLAPEARHALRAQIIGDATRPILISVGRFSPPKAYADLVTAFDALHKTHPRAALVIVGDGALFDAVAAQVAALGLRDHIKLLGARNDVPALLAASDLYVSSSVYEGLPLTILEAMSAGLPIVATSVGDVPRVVISGAGSVVPPQAPAQLASALRAMLDRPEQMCLMGATAQTHALANYSPSAWLEKLLALYAQAGT